MLAKEQTVVSPSRTYVAVCNNSNFDGHYFKKFTLPKSTDELPEHAKNLVVAFEIANGQRDNNAAVASWYFLNVLNYSACIDGCFSFEDFQDLTEQKSV